MNSTQPIEQQFAQIDARIADLSIQLGNIQTMLNIHYADGEPNLIACLEHDLGEVEKELTEAMREEAALDAMANNT